MKDVVKIWKVNSSLVVTVTDICNKLSLRIGDKIEVEVKKYE